MAMANIRLQREIASLPQNICQYYSLHVDPNNILNWSANIHCLPIKGIRKAYNIEVEITCPQTYPFHPPVIKFLKKLDHPCVDKNTGQLKIPHNSWTPTFTIGSIMHLVVSLLTDNKETY